MKKIAITTWVGNTSLNYGSALQTVALQQVLREMKVDAITINHQYQYRNNRSYLSKLLFNFIEYNHKSTEYKRTKIKFDRFFNKYAKISRICFDDKDVVKIAKKCDGLICGSDSIWKSNWIKALFLWDYKELDGKTKVAYAPSIGVGKVGYDMEKALKSFSALSVRDDVSKKLIQRYTDKNVETVLDPTLVIGKAFWENVARERLIKQDYILCYFLSDVELHRLSIEDVKRKYNVSKVIYINTNWIDKQFGFTDYRGEDYKGTVGPQEFISLIKYANVVCTDSFHGSVFSIIFHKQFLTFGREMLWKNSEDYRFSDLFNRLGIEHRVITNNMQIVTLASIEYEKVDKKLELEREKSRQFLIDSINLLN